MELFDFKELFTQHLLYLVINVLFSALNISLEKMKKSYLFHEMWTLRKNLNFSACPQCFGNVNIGFHKLELVSFKLVYNTKCAFFMIGYFLNKPLFEICHSTIYCPSKKLLLNTCFKRPPFVNTMGGLLIQVSLYINMFLNGRFP